MKKNTILIILIILLSLLVIGVGAIVIYNKIFQTNNTNYSIVYYNDDTPGSKSKINIHDNNKVEIITTHFCSEINCEPTTEKEIFNYSEANMNKLKKFISDNFEGGKKQNIELKQSELNERQNEVISCLLLGEYFFETEVEEYKYKIEYSKTNNLSYDIYFKDDKSIIVKSLKINDDYDITKIDTYSLDFSNKNLNILNSYIEKEVKKENSNIIYKYSTLQKDEINLFNSIVENDESYLNNIEDEAKLSYTISYNGINCQTPILYLYDDNTYEYYYTYTFNNEILISKTGKYNYDISKIIDKISDYSENPAGPYIIEDNNDNSYITYNSNKELMEFLNSIDVELGMCLEQQD